MLVAALAGGMLSAETPAAAATAAWNGSGSSNWATGTNWTPNGAPVGTTTVTIDLSPGPSVTAAGAVASAVDVGNTATGALTISGGGTLGSTTGAVGKSAGSNGTATVTGTGSSWTNSSSLTVGGSGTGTLNIESSGAVSDTTGTLGNSAGSNGTATVTGSGSSWSNSSSLTIGGSGAGTLNIENGGAVSSKGSTLGSTTTGSSGTATVTGSGSGWTNSGNLNIGGAGSGTLDIESGGTVSDVAATVGNGGGSTGTATVTGAGSSWTNSSSLTVGNFGTGTLNIENGGSVSSVGAGLGNAAGSIGSATVAGAGSTWSDTGNFSVGGGAGTGTLTVTDGATVAATGTLKIANQAGATGTLNIGAAAGGPAAAPGTVSASTVAFGAGTGTLVFNHTSSTYSFAPAITGAGTIDALAGNTLLTGELSGFTGTMDVSPGANLSTMAAQQSSLQTLAADQRASLIESHATAGELLGMTRPVDGADYAYAGAMLGSAVAYTGGQHSERGVTVLGGIAYGAQDYPGIRQGDDPTFAAALRYTFEDPFGDKGNALHPYGELGAWITPQADYTLSRNYANGSGQGVTNATSWAEYGRAGLAWKASADDRLSGFGELGQQFMSFDPYSELASASNPFPAAVEGGLLRLDVARIGGSWTRDLSRMIYAPIWVTLAGAAARSFDVHSGLSANVAGVGVGTAGNEADTWGEFGARIEAGLTDGLALDVDLNGTTGGGALGTVLHGGVGMVYKF
jgi:T5SS/PEP-CTERM-associated repeat protein